jgi:hypothetical protein
MLSRYCDARALAARDAARRQSTRCWQPYDCADQKPSGGALAMALRGSYRPLRPDLDNFAACCASRSSQLTVTGLILLNRVNRIVSSVVRFA